MNTKNYRVRLLLPFIAYALLFLSISSLFIFLANLCFGKDSPSGLEISASEPPIVIIDAGHGGEDGGTVGVNGALEKDINLILAKKLQVFLSSFGVKSILTRDEDILLYDRNEDYEGRKKILDMQARRKIAESYENAVFVSIHQNAFPEERYSGLQVYYSPNDEHSLMLAQVIEQNIKASLQPENNRVSKCSNGSIYLLDKLECPSVLIECGFLSNSKECELLCSEKYQNKLCAVIASSIADFVKKEY